MIDVGMWSTCPGACSRGRCVSTVKPGFLLEPFRLRRASLVIGPVLLWRGASRIPTRFTPLPPPNRNNNCHYNQHTPDDNQSDVAGRWAHVLIVVIIIVFGLFSVVSDASDDLLTFASQVDNSVMQAEAFGNSVPC
jgi:hypothetical protein